MTKFVRSLFDYHGGYLTYGTDRRFVARFKHNARDRSGFVSFLIKNFTVEEYFGLYDNGRGMAPAEILRTKGYISKTVKNTLDLAGYPATPDGYAAYIADRVAQNMARYSQTA